LSLGEFVLARRICLSGANHCQQHLEAFDCPYGMRLVGRQDNRLPGFEQEWVAGNPHLSLSIQHVEQGVERGSVFAEFLTLVKW